MQFISKVLSYILLLAFAGVMFAITIYFAKFKVKTKESFLLANRKVGWILGGASIAASWIWAPALFVSSQMAYQKGLAGLFWFTLPNALALIIFAFFAPRIRDKFPKGFTLPQYIKKRLKSERVHKIYLVPYFFYQLMAVTVQLFAGGTLLSLLTGINLVLGMLIIGLIVFGYTWISGFKASVITDFVQLGMIFLAIIIVVPFVIIKAGGFSAISLGFHGIENIVYIFDPWVAFSFGIVTAIGLISGAISDQQYWQRAFAIKRKDLKKAFIFGGLLFAVVPILLSALGFIAVSHGFSVPSGVDVSMIGVQTVASLLPTWAIALFLIILLAGLSSTLDSGLSAASSLWVIDVAKSKRKKAVRSARFAMLGISVLGFLVAITVVVIPGFGLKQLWWIFNTIAACVAVPTILSLYWKKLNEKGVFYGVLVSFFVGIPFFIYGNIINNPYWIVGSSLFVIGISTFFCIVISRVS